MIRCTRYLIILLIVSCSKNEEFREYAPLVWNGDFIVEESGGYDGDHANRIEHVLKYYHVKYKRDGDTIFVESALDREMQWSFTTKARDENWLKEHPVK